MLEHQPLFVVIDPLFAFTGKEVDIHRANNARAIMAPLGKFAEESKCAILCIRHLNKSEKQSPGYRGMGSIDFTAACRSELLIARSPDDPDEVVLVHTKHNLSARGPSLRFCFEAGQLVYAGSSHLRAKDVFKPQGGKASGQAKNFLSRLLRNGPVPASEGLAQAESAGVANRTLSRAKKELGIESRKPSGKEFWWGLPGAFDDGQVSLVPKQVHQC